MLNHHGGNLTRICSTYGVNPEDIIDFSANINPFGFPTELYDAVNSNLENIIHYPDPDCTELRELLANVNSCSKDNILIGNGSTELFYLICRTICPERGLVFQPTFTEFARALRCSGADVREITCDERDMFRVDTLMGKHCELQAQQMECESDSSLFSNIVFICNPNNPTGHLINKDDILHLTDILTDTLVVVDEAFMDFVVRPERNSVMPYASERDNLIVVKSLTKFYGVPGIRLGFLVAQSEAVKTLLMQKEPWSVNSIALEVGKLVVNDEKFIINTRDYINKEKIFMYTELTGINGLWAFEPAANFLLIKITDDKFTASIVYDKLIKLGLVIRNCMNFPGLTDKFFRVAVKAHNENIKLIQALRNIFEKNA